MGEISGRTGGARATRTGLSGEVVAGRSHPPSPFHHPGDGLP